MHIVFFEFVLRHGGARRSTVETAERLAKHVKVSVVEPYGCCQPFAEAVRQAGLDYYVLDPQAGKLVGGAYGNIFHRAFLLAKAMPGLLRIRHRLATLLREIRPTIVCCNETKGMALASKLPGMGDLPVVGFFRGWYTPDKILPYVRRTCERRLSAMVGVSRATSVALRSAGLDQNKIFTIRNPIDVDQMQFRAEQPLQVPLPQNERTLRILLPGDLQKTKGQQTAIRALGPLLDAGYDPVLYLAGAIGFQGDDSQLAEMKKLAEQLGVSDRVEWLGLRDDIPQLMKAASVVILPSYSEGMPRAALEAMSLAKPFAATPVGGLLDLVLHGVTALCFEVEDDAGLARCLMRVADDPQGAQQMGLRAQAFVQENFRPEDHTRQLLELFEQLEEG